MNTRDFLVALENAEDMPIHHQVDIMQHIHEVIDYPQRPGWDEYFLGIAQAVAARGECTRSRVGAVLVRDKRIVATGYNGVAAGRPSCLDGMCPRANNNVPKGVPYKGDGYCIAVHAELNALRDANVRGLDLRGCTIYITKEPCEVCADFLAWYELTVVWQQNPQNDRSSTTESDDFSTK